MAAAPAFELVIFDLDGTLVDSMACLADWLHRALADHLPPGVTPATIMNSFGPTEEHVIGQFVSGPLVRQCLDRYYELYDREHDRMRIYPGIPELLAALHARGIPLALCTGKSRRNVEVSLARYGWSAWFRAVVTGDETRRYKPDPEGLNRILALIPARRERVLFVGDSPADRGAARRAGIRGARAAWGFPTRPGEDSGPTPDFTLATPGDLLRLTGAEVAPIGTLPLSAQSRSAGLRSFRTKRAG